MKQLAFLALALFSGAQAKISTQWVKRDARNIILIEEPFGFSDEGFIDLTVSNVEVGIINARQGSTINYDRIGFFITTSQAEAELEAQYTQGMCMLDVEGDNVEMLFTLKTIFDKKANASGADVSNHVNLQVPKGGQYSIFYTSCDANALVTFRVRTELYNLKDGGVKDYLPLGEDALPTMYTMLTLLFALATGMWVYSCWANREHVHKIHHLMTLLGAFKILTLMCQAGMYGFIQTRGDAEGWNVAYYVFSFFRGLLFFTVAVLVGTGWSYMKPFLAEREKKILMTVIPLQIFSNMAIIILDETTPAARNWFTWRDIFHLVDIVCCCAILFPIVWSIKHLRDGAHVDGKAARNLQKLMLFRQYYVMLVAYIYFTRIVVFLLRSTVPYETEWFADAAGEMATLAFYVTTAIKFKPAPQNPYFALEMSDYLDDESREILDRERERESDRLMGLQSMRSERVPDEERRIKEVI